MAIGRNAIQFTAEAATPTVTPTAGLEAISVMTKYISPVMYVLLCYSSNTP